jgi:anaerobic selenocysteine-containing dehydrogenase
VEPRLSTSAAKSEEWVPIRPATDRQFAMGLSHVLVKEGLCDYRFLRKDTNAPYLVGPDGTFVRNAEGKIYIWDTESNSAKLWDDPSIGKLALEGTYQVEGKECKPAFQRYLDILDECSPEAMEKITTVPAETTRQIAREFAKAAQIGATIEIDGRTLPYRPAAFNWYRGAQGHKHGFQTNHAFQLLNMLIGNISAPGGLMGVTLDDQWIDKSHVEPGENGMLKPNPHQLGPLPPFQYPLRRPWIPCRQSRKMVPWHWPQSL